MRERYTYSKNSRAGLVELYRFCWVTGLQLSVFHGLPHDVHGSFELNEA